MRGAPCLRRLRRLALAASIVLALTGSALAHDVFLVARQFDKMMPDGSTVKMWGFAVDADSNLATVGPEVPTVPGPRIVVPPGDGTLNIHVRNDLPVPVGALATRNLSIVIPGQRAVLSPVKFQDAQGRDRTRSFTHETAPGTVGTYSWTNIRPGTYLYGSGTHPAVQVQMGLYGAMTADAAAGLAYPGNAYNAQVLLVYSEIDPALHDAVAGPALSYGTAAYPSTLHYKPAWFLVNGQPHVPGRPAELAGGVGQRVLLRLLNGGLKHHAPLILNARLNVIAEDGNLYPYPREQYSVLLPPGKTTDAIFMPSTRGMYTLLDRSHHLTNSGAFGGGMFSRLAVGPNQPPVAVNDAATASPNVPRNILVVANDTDPENELDPGSVQIQTGPAQGTVLVNPPGQPLGTVRYTGTQLGNFSFTYTVRDAFGAQSNVATVNVNVTLVNNPPVAVNDSATTPRTAAVDIAVLSNDSDDGALDPATIVITQLPTRGRVIVNPAGAPPGTIRYTPSTSGKRSRGGTDTFRYTVRDNDGALSNVATVTVVVQ